MKQEDNTQELSPDNVYRKALGKLLYISTLSRPDIGSAVGILCRKTALPTNKDWNAVRRLVRYLKGTAYYKLKLPANERPKLVVYVDADWGGDMKSRECTRVHIFFYGGGAISWLSKKQDIIALSSTEAKYVSAAQGCQEIQWLRRLLTDLGMDTSEPTEVKKDNQSCISLAEQEDINM
uniref:uncharacterized protein LOC130486819 n=1 Tax=Euleptes europaea TaxID=460621 RepID=UPI002540F83F|nr:uncharacterized protein LOC130486819 [Euleptes europaea]